MYYYQKNISQVMIAFYNFQMSPNFFCQCNDLHSSENILTRPAKFEYIFTIHTYLQQHYSYIWCYCQESDVKENWSFLFIELK